ncbi:MAG: ABC transporter ATP-binding protein/permease [Candidatus Omnitrophica bacterium]|nr:ABC transporter ATP-binding protein/permease [Candidatus Omnitrophota bacterium]
MNKPQVKLFLKFSKHLVPYWKKEITILALTFLGVGVGLINPYLTKLVIDRAFADKDLKIFLILVLIGGGAFILNGILQGIERYIERYITIRVNFDLSRKVFRHLERMDLEYYKSKSSGGHHFRMGNDISQAGNFITGILPQVVTLFPKLLVTLVIVFYLNWKMAFFSLFLTPLLYAPPYYFTKKLRRVLRELLKNSEDIFKMLREFFSHIQVVKVFAKEKAAAREYIRRLISNIRIQVQNTRLEIVGGFAGGAVTKLVIGLISFYGGYQVIKGRMSLGSLTAIMMYIGQLIGMQGSFAGFFQNIATGLISCERIDEILEEKPLIVEIKSAKDISLRRGDISFQKVIFGYKGRNPILHDISFTIEGGSFVAIVGPSGCGKTTILNLILRLYEPWSGDIIIDDYDIKDLKSSSLKGQIGMALQEPMLWNKSVADNIRYGNAHADLDEIIEIAKICGVNEFVKGMQEGYHTIVGDSACRISEGQKQKIAIARALVRRPRILILDEAMSSMDSASEERIVRNIKKKKDIFTKIIVSHRFSTVIKADKVCFLKGPGEMVIASGEELIKNSREFSDLFAGQVDEACNRSHVL